MSYPLLNINDFRIIIAFSHYVSQKLILVEETQTKKLKIAIEFNNSNMCTIAGQPSISEILNSILKFIHPLLTSIYGYCFNNFEGKPSFMLFHHYMPYGSIKQILEAERNGEQISNFSSTSKYIILLGIALGLKYSHSRGKLICHLSTNSIYADENLYPRFIDIMELDEDYSIYKAPEILNGQENSYASDVYTFSIIAYELITGEKPLIPKGQKRPNILNIKIESIRTLISKCWSENPEERPSFCQILEILMSQDFHKYFNANEEEVTKYLNLFDDNLKNPNFLKPFNFSDSNSGKNADEIFIKALNMFQKDEDKKEIAKLFKAAAELGNDESMLLYSIRLENGEGIPINKKESIRFLKMAVDKGNLEAICLYAIKCKNGDGVKADLQKAIYYFKLAADKGHVDSMINLGNIYMNNIIDLKQSAHYLKMAADHGKAEGVYYYGYLLFNFFNETKKGIEYIKMAADKGMVTAMNTYSHFILENPEFKEKKKEAAKYLRKAAKYGNTFAMMNYGKMLFDGDGIQMNRKKGIQYIRKAANLGNVRAMEVFVGCFFSLKIKNENTADYFSNEDVFNYQKMIVETGDPDAYHNFGNMFKFGFVCPIDNEKASYFMKLAADKGCIDAMHDYGIMCRDGNGTKINKKEAARYFKMAADKGNSFAMKDYALMCYEGDGIEKNLNEARKYMEMSKNAGNPEAIIMFLNNLA